MSLMNHSDLTVTEVSFQCSTTVFDKLNSSCSLHIRANYENRCGANKLRGIALCLSPDNHLPWGRQTLWYWPRYPSRKYIASTKPRCGERVSNTEILSRRRQLIVDIRSAIVMVSSLQRWQSYNANSQIPVHLFFNLHPAHCFWRNTCCAGA